MASFAECGRVSGLLMRLYARRWPLWVFADRAHIGPAGCLSLGICLGVPVAIFSVNLP